MTEAHVKAPQARKPGYAIPLCLVFWGALSLPAIAFGANSDGNTYTRADRDAFETEDQLNTYFYGEGGWQPELLDSTLPLGSEPHTSAEKPKQDPNERHVRVDVVHHNFVNVNEIPRRRTARGVSLIYVGLLMTAVCMSLLASNRNTRSLSYADGIRMHAKSLANFRDVPRSIFVLFLVLAAPFSIGLGIKRLWKQRKSWKGLRHLDEIAVISTLVDFLGLFLFFFSIDRNDPPAAYPFAFL